MPTLQIKYPELRSITASVIDFISKEYWWEKDSSLKTEIEADLGISGDDAWELMQKFSKRYAVDLADFRFDKYFTPEAAHSSFILWIPLYLFFFVIWIGKVVITFLLYPFSRKLSSRFSNSMRPMIDKTAEIFDCRKLESITVADLVTSAVCGRFEKRDTVKFIVWA